MGFLRSLEPSKLSPRSVGETLSRPSESLLSLSVDVVTEPRSRLASIELQKSEASGLENRHALVFYIGSLSILNDRTRGRSMDRLANSRSALSVASHWPNITLESCKLA